MREITKIKVKYYSKEVLKYLLLAGVAYVAASSPNFILSLTRKISRKRLPKKKIENTFKYLKRWELVEVKREGCDVRIALTPEGEKRAGKYQINDLKITKPKKWDKKWRMVIFDIPNVSRLIRDIFRKKLKEFGFYRFQQSAWVYPYPCQEEVKLLRDFLGVDSRQIQVFEANLEGDLFLRKIFKL